MNAGHKKMARETGPIAKRGSACEINARVQFTLAGTGDLPMNLLGEMARETGLEPATSGVTGRRSNQLNYSRLGSAQCLRQTV